MNALLVGHDLSGASRRERTLAWRHFTGMPSRLVRTPAERSASEAGVVAELRDAHGRYPADEHLNAMIEDLLDLSPRFAELWEQRPVGRAAAKRKTFTHPEVGTITLDCDALEVQGSDLNVIVYTAAPGSPDADSLALLAAIGTQTFST